MDEFDEGAAADGQEDRWPVLGESTGGPEPSSVGPLAQSPAGEAAATTPLAVGHHIEGSTTSGAGPAEPKKRHRALVVSVVALVLIAAGVAGVLATSGGSSAPGSGMSPASFVVSSTQNTVAQRTADIDVSGSISINGATIPVSGSGQADFTTSQFSASMDFSSATHTVNEKELESGGQVYMGLSVDGQNVSALTGGAQWIQIPVPQQSAGSIGAADVDPITAIKMLEQRGATIVPLGSSMIGTDEVSGYSVTPSQAEIQSALEQEVQSAQLPASALSSQVAEAKALGSFDVDIWIDGNNLLRRESITIAGGTSGATVKVAMTFQDYGTPVSIAPPAPGSVVSFSQFMQNAKNVEPTQSSWTESRRQIRRKFPSR